MSCSSISSLGFVLIWIVPSLVSTIMITSVTSLLGKQPGSGTKPFPHRLAYRFVLRTPFDVLSRPDELNIQHIPHVVNEPPPLD